MNASYDIAVVGSGFAGSLLAMIAHQLGHSVILLERGRHPRFAIGESSTPLSNILLENLCTRYNLPTLSPLSKWGSWQRTYPQVACGLKRGFTFYHHTLGAVRPADPHHHRELLVAASPHDEIADTHWFREDVDNFLVQQAQKIRVTYLDEVSLQSFSESEKETVVTGRRNNENIHIRAQFLVDATGPRGFLHRVLPLEELPLPDFPATEALFSHFTGVSRIENQSLGHDGEIPPYPVDDAAVHHVFDGGWIYVLKFNNGITSAGVCCTGAIAAKLKLSEGAPAWQRPLDLIPALKEQFANARAIRPFTHMPQLSFRSSTSAGNRWALLPSAAGFVDPLLSTGFPLTLLGVTRLAEIIASDWDQPQFQARLRTYAQQTDNELLAAARLIATLYATMDRFPLFTSTAMLYFAAASFAESVRRLGKPHLAPSFLLHDHQHFGPAMQQILEHVRASYTENEIEKVAREIQHAIEPINIAGLANPQRKNWYPVDAADLLNSATNVESTEEEINQLLKNCGFWKTATA